MTRRSYLKNAEYKGVRSKAGAKSLSGKLWPTGEFSYGPVPARPDERLDLRPVSASLLSDDGTEASAFPGGRPQGAGPLDLSNVSNSRKSPQRPERYGKKGITGYGKKMVKSVGALIDRQYPSHRVTFATITMPSVPPEQRREMAQAWPVFVNRLLERLRRILEKRGLPTVVCSVSEVQPKRLEGLGEGYLHLHVMWLNLPGRAGNWAVDVLNLRAWCKDFWLRKGLIGDDDYINIDVRAVKGKKANYLAKYCSKGGDVIAEFAEDNGWDAVPSQWWNLTKAARDWVKSNLLTGREVGEKLAQWLNWAWDYDNFTLYRYIYHVEIDLDGVLVTVGWRGCLTEEGCELYNQA